MRSSSPQDDGRLQMHKWTVENECPDFDCWCVMPTHTLMGCALWHHNLSQKEFLTEIWLHNSTPHALLDFASSGNHPLSCFFVFQFPLVGQITLLLAGALLFRSSSFFSSLRVRQSPWSHRPRVDVALRLHLVAARQTSQCQLTSRSHPARRQQRPRFLSCVLPPSAAAAVLLLFHCLILGAPIAQHCNC